MPPSEPGATDGWVHSEQLILPRQELSANEVEGFLDYLFCNIAVKPKRLGLRETARVVRYLLSLSLDLPGGQERRLLESIAEVIWLTLSTHGRVPMAEKQEVMHFLQEHSRTYLSSFDVERILRLVRGRDDPINHQLAFRPPVLMGKNRSVSGGGRAQLHDDLTERIYVAYYALQRAGVRNVRGHIAKALNRLGLQTRAKAWTHSGWGAEEVVERIRQFQDRLERRHHLSRKPDRGQHIERLRDMLVNSWIHGFHFARAIEASQGRTPEQGGSGS